MWEYILSFQYKIFICLQSSLYIKMVSLVFSFQQRCGMRSCLAHFHAYAKRQVIVWPIYFPEGKVWHKLKLKGSKKMLKLDQMLHFPGLNICLESPLYRVFLWSASCFGTFMPPEKKVLCRRSVSYWVWSWRFFSLGRNFYRGFFFLIWRYLCKACLSSHLSCSE